MSQIDNGTAYPLLTTPVGSDIVLGYRPAGADPMNRMALNKLSVDTLNGQSLQALATGLIKNTTSTGAPVIATAGVDYATPSQIVGMKNRLINGAFNVNQPGLTTAADAVYHLDQWYALTETGSVTIAQQTDQENGQPTSLRMTQPDVTAKRIGSAQPIESINCRDLRGQTVAFRARIRCSVSQAIRYAIVEWTGTADAITKDVVSSWTSGTFTTGNFFIATTTIAATGSVTPAANTWTDLLASATISSSANNLIVFIWSEGTLAQNATLDLGAVQLAQGAQTPFEARPVALEVEIAQRFYEKSFNIDTGPAQNAGTAGAMYFAQVVAGAVAQMATAVRFKVEKRSTPTITLYNPNAANAQIRNDVTVSDWSGSAASSGGTSGFRVSGTGPSGSTSGNSGLFHWSADSRL